jgi:hypothetical protein
MKILLILGVGKSFLGTKVNDETIKD